MYLISLPGRKLPSTVESISCTVFPSAPAPSSSAESEEEEIFADGFPPFLFFPSSSAFPGVIAS